MTNVSNKKWWIVTIVVVAVVLTGLFRLYASRSDATKFAQGEIRRSPVVQSRIGTVTDVHLALFGPYRSDYASWGTRTQMDVEARGNKGSATISIKVTDRDGDWKVEEATIDGQPVVLN